METLWRQAPASVWVMLHEGVKCARYAREVLFHPWSDYLHSNVIHLGWIGGANRPQCSDWAGLQNFAECWTLSRGFGRPVHSLIPGPT
jgi:hypothetical protein